MAEISGFPRTLPYLLRIQQDSDEILVLRIWKESEAAFHGVRPL